MKILVVGGAGYIGCRLVPKLLARNYTVDVADVFMFGNNLPRKVALIKEDLFDLNEEHLRGYDQVIFLAGLSNDPMAECSPSQNFIWNAAAPAYLAYIAKKVGIPRYIYASSCSVYGYTEEELYDENAPTTVQFAYGISKLQGEKTVIHMQDDKFSVIALRKGTVCGYSPRMRLDLVVNTMYKTAMADGIIRVTSPSIWRPIVAMEDAVSAYIRAIETNESISGVFNISSGNYTLGAIADDVRDTVERLSGKKIRFDIQNVKDLRNYKVSTDKAQKILSFSPAGSVRSIVEDLYANHEKFSDFSNPNYYNIEVFKKWQEAKLQ